MRKNIGLLLVSLAAILIIAELLLRRFAPIEAVNVARMYQYDPETGFALQPNLRIYETTDFQKEIISNALGTADFREKFDTTRPMVFALGDSYTEGCGIPADMSFPFQLDMVVNRDTAGAYSPHYTIVNLGVFGYGGEQSLRRLKEYIRKLGKPSVVLYLGYDNDFADDQSFLNGYRHTIIVKGSPYWPAWLVGPLQTFIEDVQLVKRIRLAFHQVRGDVLEDMIDRTMADSLNPVAAREEDLLDRVVDECQNEQARLIVSWMGPSPSYGWMKQWAKERGIAFADWLPKVYSMQSAIPALPMGNHHSGGHVRGWVERIIAEEYARQLRYVL